MACFCVHIYIIYRKQQQFSIRFFLFQNNILLLHTLAAKRWHINEYKEWQKTC
jgi:hypothetical protein